MRCTVLGARVCRNLQGSGAAPPAHIPSCVPRHALRRQRRPPRGTLAATRAAFTSSPGDEGGKTYVYYPREAGARKWAEEMAREDPGLDLQVEWEDSPREPSEDTTFAVIWKPPPGVFDGHPNLRAVQLTGAGVDAVLPSCPAHIPVARIIDPVMSQRMAAWVLLQCLSLMRRSDDYARAQASREWIGQLVEEEKDVPDTVVGVMGMGGMGGASAELLARVGFDVRGWVRSTPRGVPGVSREFVGDAELGEFLGGLDVLVCLLPLTAETRGIVGAETLAALPRGACVVNAARGQHVVAEDLLAALDSGHVRQAVLDVFAEEPLPAGSPLWGHPRVRVTPHVSAKTNVRTSVGQVLENRRRALAGEPLLNAVDTSLGY